MKIAWLLFAVAVVVWASWMFRYSGHGSFYLDRWTGEVIIAPDNDRLNLRGKTQPSAADFLDR